MLSSDLADKEFAEAMLSNADVTEKISVRHDQSVDGATLETIACLLSAAIEAFQACHEN
jgi:hypothetical protein